MNILIVSDSLRVGGIQRSLENLLNIIDYEKHDVTLFLFHYESKYMDRINKNVNVINGNRILSIANTTSKEAKQKGILFYFIRKIFAVLCAVFGANLVYKFMFRFESKKTDYDVAISFSNNINNRSVYFGVNKFVLEKVDANRKITWLHVDYKEMKMDNEINKKEYSKFNTVVHVSNSVKNSFLSYYPEFKDKCKVVYNAIPVEKIKELSKKFTPCKKARITIVSVGRLDKNKSPKSYVEIAHFLKNNNVDYHWWIIGDGPEKNGLIRDVERYNLSQEVSILGEMSNPYPYIKSADLFVSASKSESFGLAIAEAIVLKTLVIARYYPAIEELIINRVNGIISYGDDCNLANSILNIINDTDMINKIKSKSDIFIDNLTVYEQFEELINL